MYELAGSAHGRFETEAQARMCIAQCRDLGVDLRDVQIRQATDADPTPVQHPGATEASWRKQAAAPEEARRQEAGSGKT